MRRRTPPELSLNARDEALLDALTRRVRLITAPLVAVLWASSVPVVGRRLARLHRADLLLRARVMAHPLLDLAEPLIVWAPGDPDPEAGPASYRAKTRWDRAPVSTTVFLASRRTARLFGGSGGRFDYPLQATHDLHVTALYVRLVRRDPETAACWRGEETIRRRRRRGKVADAVLVDHRERPVRAVEFGGSYRTDRIAAFHRVCKNRHLPYELW